MGLVASIRGEKSHEIIRKGLEVLINLTHRGAAGAIRRRATAPAS
jgi:glutamate synthase (NADPH/NADH) large chain